MDLKTFFQVFLFMELIYTRESHLIYKKMINIISTTKHSRTILNILTFFISKFLTNDFLAS